MFIQGSTVKGKGNKGKYKKKKKHSDGQKLESPWVQDGYTKGREKKPSSPEIVALNIKTLGLQRLTDDSQ